MRTVSVLALSVAIVLTGSVSTALRPRAASRTEVQDAVRLAQGDEDEEDYEDSFDRNNEDREEWGRAREEEEDDGDRDEDDRDADEDAFEERRGESGVERSGRDPVVREEKEVPTPATGAGKYGIDVSLCPSVHFYYNDSCMYCAPMREFLDELGISYSAFDVAGGGPYRERLRELFKGGTTYVPTTVVGETIFTGPNKGGVLQALRNQCK